MATILVVDDRPTNRELLTTLLGYHGHRLLEAADGAEALAAVAAHAERPDLVITDVLMPVMDGYELVRRMRADPVLAAVPVVFCTAHYRLDEVQNLARSCGVSHILTKACEPDVVLRVVEAALRAAPSIAPPPLAEFHREHVQVLTDKLAEKANELRATNDRLALLIAINLELASERGPRRLLDKVCQAARSLLGAQYAALWVVGDDGRTPRHFLTSGLDAETAARLGSPSPPRVAPGALLAQKRTHRLRNADGDPTAVGLPALHPPVYSWLGAVVASPSKQYGWLCLADKVGAEEFSEEDERLAEVLAGQVGRIYENGSLYEDALRHAEELEREAAERKRAEAALRQSHDLLRAVAHGTPDAVFVKDRSSRYLLFNPAAAAFVGKAAEEVLGKDDTALFGPEDAHVVMARDRQVMESGKAETDEEVLTAAGATRTYLATKAPYRDEQGHIVGVIGISRDITGRKRAEAERDAALARLRLQIDRMALAYITFDSDLRISDWNPAAEKIFGFSKEEALGRGVDLILLPEVLAGETGERLRRLQAGDMAAHGLNANRTRDGRTIVCEWFNTPLIDEAGRFTGLLSQALDVTDRIAAEEALQLRDRAIQAVTQGILITDPSQPGHPIIYASPGFERLTGYPAEEVVGRNCRFLQGPKTDPEAVAQVREATRARRPCSVELLNYRKDGTPFWNALSVSPIWDDGRLTHFVGVQTDVTERRTLEEQFRQAQKMEAIGRLAGGVAHDFNNLLTVIGGYSDLLLNGMGPNDPSYGFVREIRRAGERASGLTHQLLAFSRKQVLAPAPLDLNAVVAEAEKMLRRLIGEDVDLAAVLDPDLGLVLADPGQIEQVLLNLAVNARDAMPGGGRLTIETRNVELDAAYAAARSEVRPGPYVLLAVSDTGCGMTAEVQARIFEPFFTTKEVGKGTGLGLATVYGIAKQSNGHVAVYSEPGQGTTFKVYLPRSAEATPTQKADKDLFKIPEGDETILLAEDEDGVRTLARLVLESCGYSVLEARDGAEALRLGEAEPGPVHLLATDVVMPKMSGRQLADALRAGRPGLKVLFLSGYTEDVVVRHDVLEADMAFLEKPFTPAALARKVRQVLDRGGPAHN